MSIDPNIKNYNILNEIDVNNIRYEKNELNKQAAQNEKMCKKFGWGEYEQRTANYLVKKLTALNILENAIESLSKKDVNLANQTLLDEKVYQVASEYLEWHGSKFEVGEKIQVDDLKKVIWDYLSITDVLLSEMADDEVTGIINGMGEGHIKQFIWNLCNHNLPESAPLVLAFIQSYKKYANEASIKSFYESITKNMERAHAGFLNALRQTMTAEEKISYPEFEAAIKQRLINLGYEAINRPLIDFYST